MPVPEGRTFSFESDQAIRSDFLEVLDYNGTRQEITIETEEFTAVCPFSGLPDFGKIIINYIPDSRIIELKSFKYYLVSFRNAGIYQEAVTDRIFRDLYGLLKPRRMTVKSVYNIRGGILTTCFVDSDTLGGIEK